MSFKVDDLAKSATANLQIPYLFSVADMLRTYLGKFPLALRPTFGLLRKIDHAFASSLAGADIETAAVLPGYEFPSQGGMSTTDMIRCKSIVVSTRLEVIEVMDQAMEHEPESTYDGLSSETDNLTDESPHLLDGLHMDAARVYEHTIVGLGQRLGDLNMLGDPPDVK